MGGGGQRRNTKSLKGTLSKVLKTSVEGWWIVATTVLPDFARLVCASKENDCSNVGERGGYGRISVVDGGFHNGRGEVWWW